MRLGLGSYTFTWAVGVPGHPPRQPLTPLDLLQRASQLGVRVVQFCDNLPLATAAADGGTSACCGCNPNLSGSLGEVMAFARERGIAIQVGTRGIADVASLLAHLELARRVESPFLRVVVDSSGHEPTPDECVSRLRPLLPRFAEAGVRLAIENHDRFTSATLVRMIEQLGPAHVGICLDTVNSFGALEGPEVVVKALAPHTLNLHVKDFTIERVSSQMGFEINGAAAGQGRLNVPWLLDQLRAAGRDVDAILELWTPPGATLDDTIAREASWVEPSVKYLRQFIPD